MYSSFDVAASGMEAQRLRLNTISSNISNVNTTRGPDGSPYRRRDVLFAASPVFESVLNNNGSSVGVKVEGVIEDQRPFKSVFQPGHPDADGNGYLKMPNVNVVEEMVNMIAAMRAYEANVTAFKNTKAMMAKTLEMGS